MEVPTEILNQNLYREISSLKDELSAFKDKYIKTLEQNNVLLQPVNALEKQVNVKKRLSSSKLSFIIY
jgi:hypothetical protein